MGNKQPLLVALDLETTGLHSEQDAIVEVAAVKFRGSTILDRFETFVSPDRPLPYRVQRLTGITPQLLQGAAHIDAIAGPLQEFIGNLPLVGHSIPFDVAFLRRRGLARNNPLIDTFELATVLLPSLTSYNLGQVAEALGLSVSPGRHRAMVDTILAMEVFLALHERLRAVDLSQLEDMASLDAPHEWPLLAFFRQELRERQSMDGVRGMPGRGSLGDRFAAQLGMDPRVLSFAVARQQTEDEAPATIPPASDATLATVQRLRTQIEVIPERESDSKQAEPPAHLTYQAAHAAVSRFLSEPPQAGGQQALLVEVTLGGSNYGPVLYPALVWLMQPEAQQPSARRRLVIACLNQQSARYVMESVLPRLWELLKQSRPVAYLAERDGYFCTHRWFGAALRRTSGELSAEEARGLAKLGLWAQQTLTGERGEISLLGQETKAWERVRSGVERITPAHELHETAYQRCIYHRKGYCFVSRAEERVNAADVVITTHAGLLDDLSNASSLLAPIERRVVLDADLFEDELAHWASQELEKSHVISMLNTIGSELPGERFQGLLALAAPSLRTNGPGGLSSTATIGKSELDAQMRNWFQMLQSACSAVDVFFTQLNHLFEEFTMQNGNNGREKGRKPAGGRAPERQDQPLRFTDQTRNLSLWATVEQTWQHAASRLQAVIDLARQSERILLTSQRNRHRLDAESVEEHSIASELAAAAHELAQQKRIGQQAIVQNDREHVYWLRMPPAPPPFMQQTLQQRQTASASGPTAEAAALTLFAQPVDVPALSRRFLLTEGARSIYAGIALEVDNQYSFCRSRLGIENEHSPALSIVTERHEQTLLYLPNDVPEPNMPQYQRHLDEALINLASALEGQLFVLYTSHAALRSSYAAIKPALEARGILVVGQGVDGSPRQLWQICSTQERVVVLGAGAFWDSIGETTFVPTCTVITRLPMPVLNDPPLAARTEHYSDQLHHVTVPMAALRLRRALNRLVWSDDRRNAVILFDRRTISKEYGATILQTLPHCSKRQGPVSHIPETILDWLTTTGSWD